MKKTFKKEERLCSKSTINALFHGGSSFVVYPFRVVYLFIPATSFDVKVIISVSKRRFKKAHDRNRIRRLMCEAYRLQKADILYPALRTNNVNLQFAIQYIAKEELPFQLIEQKMSKLLLQLKGLHHA